MMREITEAIAAVCRTIVKTTATVEHTIDLADKEVQLLDKRQNLRMAEINHELDQRQQYFTKQLEQI